jgi:predicted tellurium resistance membrane protein TerC
MEQISKYVLYASIVLNGILLMFIAGIVPFFLYLSIVFNLILLWYSAKSLYKVDDLEEDIVLLMEKNELFLENLEQIHSLEMYYGDEDLQSLINHSRELVNQFIDVQEKYFEVEITPEEYEEEGQIEEDTTTPQD